MTEANDIFDGGQQELICPKCASTMEKVHFDSYTIDRCTSCKGLFLDAIAHERLESMEGSECIDTGEPHREDYDQVVRINCPACHTRMIRMVDHRQPHIWYESCPVCFGVYLDAGEFRQQKEHTMFGTFRDMLHPHERV